MSRFATPAEFAALALALVAPSGCGLFERTSVDPHEAESVVMNRAEPAASCRLLGDVSGDVMIGSLEDANRDLRRNAALGGGNYVTLDMVERHPGGYGIDGRLFRCPSNFIAPQRPEAKAAEPTVAAPAPSPAIAPLAAPAAPAKVSSADSD